MKSPSNISFCLSIALIICCVLFYPAVTPSHIFLMSLRPPCFARASPLTIWRGLHNVSARQRLHEEFRRLRNLLQIRPMLWRCLAGLFSICNLSSNLHPHPNRNANPNRNPDPDPNLSLTNSIYPYGINLTPNPNLNPNPNLRQTSPRLGIT